MDIDIIKEKGFDTKEYYFTRSINAKIRYKGSNRAMLKKLL